MLAMDMSWVIDLSRKKRLHIATLVQLGVLKQAPTSTANATSVAMSRLSIMCNLHFLRAF